MIKYAVKHGERWLRFSSYSKVEYVVPEQATLYTHRHQAEARVADRWGVRSYWPAGWENVAASEFRVVKVEVTVREVP